MTSNILSQYLATSTGTYTSYPGLLTFFTSPHFTETLPQCIHYQALCRVNLDISFSYVSLVDPLQISLSTRTAICTYSSFRLRWTSVCQGVLGVYCTMTRPTRIMRWILVKQSINLLMGWIVNLSGALLIYTSIHIPTRLRLWPAKEVMCSLGVLTETLMGVMTLLPPQAALLLYIDVKSHEQV